MSRLADYLNDPNFKLQITSSSIYIDNYINIENLTDNNININFESFILAIEGKNFIVKKLVDKEILFTGEIKNIKFIQKLS